MDAELGVWINVVLVIVGSLLVGVAIDIVGVGLLARDVGPAQRSRRAVAQALRGQFEVWALVVGVTLFKPFEFLPAQTQAWIDKAVIVIAITSVTVFAARLAGTLIRAFLSLDRFSAPSGTIFVNLARLVIWTLGMTLVLGALGVQIGPLVASLGIAGIAISLGLQDTLANFFAGLQITLSRQIQPGQYIRLSTMQEGAVTDVTWRNTTLLAPSSDLIIIPNSVIATTLVTNFTTLPEEHIETVPFTVAFGSDLEDVRRVALAVSLRVRNRHAEAIDDFEPACTFRSIGPEGIAAAVTIAVTRFQDRLPVVSDLIESLHSELSETGVAFGTGISLSAKPPA